MSVSKHSFIDNAVEVSSWNIQFNEPIKVLSPLQIFEDCSCISNTREFESFALPSSVKPTEKAGDSTTLGSAFSTLKVSRINVSVSIRFFNYTYRALWLAGQLKTGHARSIVRKSFTCSWLWCASSNSQVQPEERVTSWSPFDVLKSGTKRLPWASGWRSCAYSHSFQVQYSSELYSIKLVLFGEKPVAGKEIAGCMTEKFCGMKIYSRFFWKILN